MTGPKATGTLGLRTVMEHDEKISLGYDYDDNDDDEGGG